MVDGRGWPSRCTCRTRTSKGFCGLGAVDGVLRGVCRRFGYCFVELKKRVFQAEPDALAPIAHRKTQNDPHNLPRLRRPIGPQRAAVR